MISPSDIQKGWFSATQSIESSRHTVLALTFYSEIYWMIRCMFISLVIPIVVQFYSIGFPLYLIPLPFHRYSPSLTSWVWHYTILYCTSLFRISNYSSPFYSFLFHSIFQVFGRGLMSDDHDYAVRADIRTHRQIDRMTNFVYSVTWLYLPSGTDGKCYETLFLYFCLLSSVYCTFSNVQFLSPNLLRFFLHFLIQPLIVPFLSSSFTLFLLNPS